MTSRSLAFRSNSVLHHATIPKSFFSTSLLPCLLTSFSAHTRSVSALTSFHFVNSAPLKKLREESALTVFWIRTQGPSGLPHRSTRELRHPGTLVPRRNCLERNDLGGFTAVARGSRPRDWFALASFRLGSDRLVSYLLFTLSEDPACARIRLRYTESNQTPFLCQALFSKIFIFCPFFAYLVTSEVSSRSVALKLCNSVEPGPHARKHKEASQTETLTRPAPSGQCSNLDKIPTAAPANTTSTPARSSASLRKTHPSV